MVLIFDFDKKVVLGNASAKDIHQLGILQASRHTSNNPFDHPGDITKWSTLWADTNEKEANDIDDWEPEPEGEKDEGDEEW